MASYPGPSRAWVQGYMGCCLLGNVVVAYWDHCCVQEKELSDYKHASVDLSSMEEELDSLATNKQKLSTKLTQLQKEQSQLSLYSSARGAIDGFKKQKKEKEDSYQLE